ncbi:PREDICTED: F-box/kelch-repeat protein At3g06240-like [Fragaria vesca subsp. vesca]
MERVLASCNGLVVLGKTSYTNLSVWNPSTGFFRKIPSPGFRLDLEDVHIFSTRDGSWKVITFPHSSFPCRDDGEDLLVSNGAIHWVSTGIPEAISAFDLVSEEFRQLPLPPALIKSILNVEPVEDRDPRRIWTQVLVGGRLCVRSHNEYWVMKQYAVPESWVKMFQFSVADMPNVFASEYVYPAFVTEGGTVVMLSGMWLARIECHNEGKPVCSSRYQIKSVHVKKDMYRSGVMVYDETLLSL